MTMMRADARGASCGLNWYRRNFWLLVIGALHGYFLWFGDILFHYALMGMLIFPLRHRSPRALIIIASILLSIGLVMQFAGGKFMTRLSVKAPEIQLLQDSGETLTEEQEGMLEQWDAMSVFMKPPEQQVEEDVAAYTGSYADAFEHRKPVVQMMQTQATFGFVIWRVGGLMLLGMALMRLGILSGERRSAYYRKVMLIGYGVGIPILLFSSWNLWVHQWEMLWMLRVGMIPNYVGSLFIAFGHIALVMLLVKSGAMRSLMERFAAVGRMAFTNYLLHTIILTTVFYGYGLGLYGQIPRVWQMGFVAAVIGFQLWMSPLWLRHFRFGPAEWLWRSLSYWQLQPMRKNVPA
jgi:uncharacterized protein